MLIDEEKKDILFQIDMQLYDEFNDKFCEMNDNLGTVYSYKDLDDLEKLEKETEIKLLRQAIEKQSKEMEELNKENTRQHELIGNIHKKWEDKIKAKIEELNKDFKEYENGQEWEIQDEIRGQIDVLHSLLEKE